MAAASQGNTKINRPRANYFALYHTHSWVSNFYIHLFSLIYIIYLPLFHAGSNSGFLFRNIPSRWKIRRGRTNPEKGRSASFRVVTGIRPGDESLLVIEGRRQGDAAMAVVKRKKRPGRGIPAFGMEPSSIFGRPAAP